MKTLTNFGNKVRFLRNKNGITQEKLSEMTDLDISFISMIEHGKKNITINTIEKIARAFNLNIIDLLSFDDKIISFSYPTRSEIIRAINEKLETYDYETLFSLYSFLTKDK